LLTCHRSSFLWWGVISLLLTCCRSVVFCDEQQTYHTLSQKTTDLWQVNNKIITPYHRNQSTLDKTTNQWQVSVMRCDKFVVDLSQVCDFLWCTLVSVMRCDKFVDTLSQKTTDLQQVNNKLTTPYHRKLQTCDKSTILW
jgi:hypothetical protein